MEKANTRYGHLTLIRPDETHQRKWLCLCDCGTIKSFWINNVKSGKTISCGCYSSRKTAERNYTHGGSKERLYLVWTNMHRRCKDPKNKRYNYYGGKGIKVCEEWSDYQRFKEWALSSGYNKDAKYGECTIERIDVNGNYEPKNCTWKSIKEQCYNRTSNHYLTYQGKTQTLTEWEDELGFKRDRLGNRLRKGWSVERAISTPIIKHGNRKTG